MPLQRAVSSDGRGAPPVRRHGTDGPPVVVLHGGLGAPGSVARLAHDLAERFRVLEPWQRRASTTPLSVARHIDDLVTVLDAALPGECPALVGASWGAMLALAFAAAHPVRVAALALVGCGTFDAGSRALLQATLRERMTPALEARIARLAAEVADDNERAARTHALCDPLYTYARAIDEPPFSMDLQGHHESWNDMRRLQASGIYPAAFVDIACPVLMLHGDYDPHPGRAIRDSLRAHMPQLEYREFARCGHTPWVEAHARAPFLAELRAWLALQLPP